MIGTKEPKGAGGHNAVWNAPFLFDLPVGEVSLLNMVLEFIIMQVRVLKNTSLIQDFYDETEMACLFNTCWFLP